MSSPSTASRKLSYLWIFSSFIVLLLLFSKKDVGQLAVVESGAKVVATKTAHHLREEGGQENGVDMSKKRNNLRRQERQQRRRTTLSISSSSTLHRYLDMEPSDTASVGVMAGTLRLIGLMIIAPFWIIIKTVNCIEPFMTFTLQNAGYGIYFWFGKQMEEVVGQLVTPP